MDENGLDQTSFEPEIPQSRISDILNGNRPISNAQAIQLGQRFCLRPSLFLGLE
jgi:plasmid maintenance system antidote protein VapI